MDYVNAFWVGGLICALVQILMEKTKMLPGRIMVLLVCLGTLLGAIQIYEPFVEFAGAGARRAVAPGFGNVLWKGVKRGDGSIWLSWNFHGRLQAKRGGHIGGVGVWLSGKPDFPAENEEISVCVLVHLVVES